MRILGALTFRLIADSRQKPFIESAVIQIYLTFLNGRIDDKIRAVLCVMGAFVPLMTVMAAIYDGIDGPFTNSLLRLYLSL